MDNINTQMKKSLEKARIHLEKGEYRNAKLMYNQALNASNASEEKAIIWAELSWVLYYEKNFDQAIEASENVLMHDPEYKAVEDLLRLQGYCYLAKGMNDMAEQMLGRALTHNSEAEKQHYVRFELGKLYFNRGEYDLAYPLLKEIVPYFSDKRTEYLSTTHFYLGFVLYHLGNNAEARTNFEAMYGLVADDSRRASALYGMAYLDFREKDYLKVIAGCEKILELDPEFYDRETLGFLTAACYFQLGRYDIFTQYREQMLAAFPDGRYRNELSQLVVPDSADGKN
jgi:tetratricopeptide (TPR) repeat protein